VGGRVRFTLTLPDGTQVFAVSGQAPVDSPARFPLVFDVPAPCSGGTLTVHPAGNLTVQGKPSTWTQPAPAKAIPLTVR
jgi:hypothetical protein